MCSAEFGHHDAPPPVSRLPLLAELWQQRAGLWGAVRSFCKTGNFDSFVRLLEIHTSVRAQRRQDMRSSPLVCLIFGGFGVRRASYRLELRRRGGVASV